MISELGTYSVEDFIPFTADTYFRLFERHNEALWPFQFIFFLIGAAVLVLFWKGWGRTAAILLGAVWVWVGIAFFMGPYGELVWAGDYFGWAFIVQGFLLGGCGRVWGGERTILWTVPAMAGAGLAWAALVLYPFWAPLTGRAWSGAEVFGVAPDPTVVFTLGVLLLAARGWWIWLMLPVPVLACLLSAATVQALEAPWAWFLPVVAGLVLILAVWKGFAGRATT